jgi:hypothetical protein
VTQHNRSLYFPQALACWNWKCALLSATARSIVYLAAMARNGMRGGVSIVLVEIAYVGLTAGVYAGMQQRALSIRSRWLGNLAIVFGVPGMAQVLDWLAHRAAGPAVPGKATLAVTLFAFVSALFHLHVMRRGVFLTGRKGRSLGDDFRRIPRLVVGFVAAPGVLLAAMAGRLIRGAESEAAL